METGPRFKVSSERPEKREMDFAIPGLVVQRVIYYITADKWPWLCHHYPWSSIIRASYVLPVQSDNL